MTEKVEKAFMEFANNLDYAEMCLTHLRWVIDNVKDEEAADEVYYDVLECANRFSLKEQQLIQFRKKISELREKYALGDKMDETYFEQVSQRIINFNKSTDGQ